MTPPNPTTTQGLVYGEPIPPAVWEGIRTEYGLPTLTQVRSRLGSHIQPWITRIDPNCRLNRVTSAACPSLARLTEYLSAFVKQLGGAGLTGAWGAYSEASLPVFRLVLPIIQKVRQIAVNKTNDGCFKIF